MIHPGFCTYLVASESLAEGEELVRLVGVPCIEEELLELLLVLAEAHGLELLGVDAVDNGSIHLWSCLMLLICRSVPSFSTNYQRTSHLSDLVESYMPVATVRVHWRSVRP